MLIASSLVFLVVPASGLAQESQSRSFAGHVLALRSAGVEGDDEAMAFMSRLPGAGVVRDEATLVELWRPFFSNAIVKLGRIHSHRPAALYYDPLLDIALLTQWEQRDGGYELRLARALLGERLARPGAAVTLAPEWMAAEEGPVDALVRVTSARLDAFRSAHPAQLRLPSRTRTTFAQDASEMRVVLPRLVWHATRRLHWVDGTQPWLEGTLLRTEAALAARDSSALVSLAPDTDSSTAEVLSRLPPSFGERLALDMTLEAGPEQRLIIGSLPDDGDIYLLVLCRLAGSACALRRLLLLSLLE